MKGSKVKISREGHEHGIQRYRKGSQRHGVITGESRDGTCWQIIWDGSKTPTSIHKSFVETIQE